MRRFDSPGAVVLDKERRDMFESLSNLLGQLPFRSLWVVGGDFNAEIGFKGGSVRKVRLVLLPTGVGQDQGIR